MRAPVLLCLAILAPPALGHDLWLERAGKHWTLYQGHHHEAPPETAAGGYGSSFVTGARCYDERGNARPLAVLGVAPWTASGDCAALLVDVSSGYWSKTPRETRNQPKAEVPGALQSWLSRDSVKRIERWSPAFAQAIGNGLEIVPTGDPLALKPGGRLVVRVMRDGRPLVGASVAYHGRKRGETDPDGRLAIHLDRPGMQLISTSARLPLNDGKADLEIRAATLQFELAR